MNLVQECSVIAVGNGATTIWPLGAPPYLAYSKDHLDVRVVTTASGAVQVIGAGSYDLILDVLGAAESIRYPTVASGDPALPGTKKIIVTRVEPYKQETDLSSGINLATLENQLDELAMQIQQLKEKLNRVPMFPLGELQPELVPSVSRLLKIVTTDALGRFVFTRNETELDDLEGDPGPPGPGGPPGVGVILTSGVAGVDNVTATGSPVVTAYGDALVLIRPADFNVGPMTLDLGPGPLAWTKPDGTAMEGGETSPNQDLLLRCAVTSFRTIAPF